MALGPNRQLFTQRWQDRLSPSINRSMAASVQFYDPQTSSATYDPVTGHYSTIPTVLYNGVARVQPVRSSNVKTNNADDTLVQTVLVSIPIAAGKTLDLRPWHRAKVTNSPLLPLLTNYVFIVRETLDSSNPLERTFFFDIDLEVRNGQ